MREEAKKNWPDHVRIKMIERSEFYENPSLYQYGYYDGYQHALASEEQREGWVRVETELKEKIEYLEEISAEYECDKKMLISCMEEVLKITNDPKIVLLIGDTMFHLCENMK